MYNGNIIKQLLAEKKIQNKELLNYLGTEANSSLSQIVNGNPTVRRLEKVADFFGVSMDVFFNREKPYQTFSTNDLNNLQLFKDKIEFSLGYEGKFRDNYEDHTGLLNAKYKF